MDKARLKRILLDQREELASLPSRRRLIERGCLAAYRKHLHLSAVKVITGIRRCGKSVLAMQLLEGRKFAYANFDDERFAALSTEQLNDVLETLYEVYGPFDYLFLDEIENITGWELFVNRLQRQGLNIVITGSNARLLSRELATHLTGRHITLNLLPFSFREFLAYRGVRASQENLSTRDIGVLRGLLSEYIETGGFPEVVAQPEGRDAYLRALYSSILERDILLRHNVRFQARLKGMAHALMENPSSPVSANRLKNAFGMKSIHTALDYLSFIEDAFLILLVPRFSAKRKEREVANRKLYCIDTGLLGALGSRPGAGRVAENIVLLELSRRGAAVSYWQDIARHEVDFVVQRNRKATQLIQVCHDASALDTRKRETSALVAAAAATRCRDLLVITDSEEREETASGFTVHYIPLWRWLLSK